MELVGVAAESWVAWVAFFVLALVWSEFTPN